VLHNRPEIQPNEILIIRNVEEDDHVIMAIHRTLYRARYMTDNNTPPGRPYVQATA
jgi:hypothetical protein